VVPTSGSYKKKVSAFLQLGWHSPTAMGDKIVIDIGDNHSNWWYPLLAIETWMGDIDTNHHGSLFC